MSPEFDFCATSPAYVAGGDTSRKRVADFLFREHVCVALDRFTLLPILSRVEAKTWRRSRDRNKWGRSPVSGAALSKGKTGLRPHLLDAIIARAALGAQEDLVKSDVGDFGELFAERLEAEIADSVPTLLETKRYVLP